MPRSRTKRSKINRNMKQAETKTESIVNKNMFLSDVFNVVYALKYMRNEDNFDMVI